MKTKYILVIGLFTATLTSCNSGIDQNAKKNTSVPSAGSPVSLPAATADAPVNPTDSNNAPLTAIPASSANTALNPAHGQPGHNCGIAVGAPLSTASIKSVAIPASATSLNIESQNPVINNSQTQLTVPTPKTSASLNPAHGQPGHKCDIAVGAPLNSKTTSSTIPPINLKTTPANSKTTVDQPTSLPTPLPVNATQPIQSSPLNVSLPQSTTPGQNSKVRLNPPHGQPGHDCSVPAGKPLKQ